MTDDNEYLKTVARLEPDICMIDAAAYYASAAISLKRIADSLEILSTEIKGNPEKYGLVQAILEVAFALRNKS